MTFRIVYSQEDFSGLTLFGVSTLPVEKRYLMLIQQDNYRHRIKNASKICIKLENLRFIFMRYLPIISGAFEYPFKH
jgi:hypothetical protein